MFHLPLCRFVGLLNNQTWQKCWLIHLVFTIPDFLTSCKSKCSSNNYLLPWKHMNYAFIPFSVYMLFSIMLYHRSTKACNLPVGTNIIFCNSVIYQLLMAKFSFNQAADHFCQVYLWPASLTCLPNNVFFIFPANIK